VLALIAPGVMGVLPFREQKLRLRGNRVALEGGDKLAALGFTGTLRPSREGVRYNEADRFLLRAN